MSNNQYDQGAMINLSGTFTNSTGGAANPTSVLLRVKPPTGATVVVTPTLTGTSTYYYNYTATLAGVYYYRFEGSGNVVAVADGQFTVNASPALT